MKTNSISYILLLICIVVCFVGCQSTDTTRQESSTIDEDNRCYYDVERYISDEIDEEDIEEENEEIEEGADL